MKILFIAPVPPPITGQSLAVKVFFDELVINHHVEVINLNKDSFMSGVNSFDRIKQVIKIFKKVWDNNKNVDAIYFSISESFAGNVKDLFIYLVCFKKLNKTIVHLLGGAGIKNILGKRGIQYRLNKFFLSRLGGIIVEGQTQSDTFSRLMSIEKIHIVPNFAEDFLFISEKEIKEKFSNTYPLQILFLSNLIYGKGHNELVDAYLDLKDELQEKVRIIFVGGFESNKNKNVFLKKIHGHKGLIYRGLFVGGYEKKDLFSHSHIFCLPTYYPYEGQPISILEAYATGCVVITTNHSGISDVFCNDINGFEVQKKSSESIKQVIEIIIEEPNKLLKIAISNRDTAYFKYRTDVYKKSLIRIIDGIRSNSNNETQKS